MKRYIIVFLSVFIANIYANDVPLYLSPYEKIKKDITNTSSQAFGRKRLFIKPINRDNVIEWKKTISRIQDFIAHHTHNPQFLAVYRNIKRIEINLTKKVFETYDAISKRFPLNRTQIIQMKKPFISIESQANSILASAKNLAVKNQDQTRVRDVISLFAFTIAFIAKKVIQDIDKEAEAKTH